MKKTKNVVIITGPGFEEAEVIVPMTYLPAEGYSVDIMTSSDSPVVGKHGFPLKPTHTLSDLSVAKYDAVIIPGGYEAPDRVRQDQHVLSFVKEMDDLGKVVGGLCHGPWIMISAQIMRGRDACAYIGMVDDMRNSGANIIDADVITDRNMVTCSYYGEVGKFMTAVFAAVDSRAGQRQAAAA